MVNIPETESIRRLPHGFLNHLLRVRFVPRFVMSSANTRSWPASNSSTPAETAHTRHACGGRNGAPATRIPAPDLFNGTFRDGFGGSWMNWKKFPLNKTLNKNIKN